MALTAALGAAVAVEADPAGPVVAGAIGAVLLMSLALVTGSAPIPFAVVLLGAVYMVPDGEREIWAPLYGCGLLLLAELAYWSLELRVTQPVHGEAVTPRLLAVLGVAAASVPAGALVLLAADAGLGRSPALTAVAALALAACAGLLAMLAKARPGGEARWSTRS